MIAGWSAILTALIYLCLLFALATWGDAAGRGFVARPRIRSLVYALSLGVYCTSWTFFGSVGAASSKGLDFLAIYIGPILAFTLGRPLILRIVRIAKLQNSTSVADFIAARYGKSPRVAALVAIIALIAAVPFVALQLKAMSAALGTILGSLDSGHVLVAQGTANGLAFVSALVLAAFAMAFGTRRIDATEHQDGLMLAIAAESIVKLVAFLAVGAFVTWGLFDGLTDLRMKAAADSQIRGMLARAPDIWTWGTVILLSAFATLLLPRQFHVAIVENRDPNDVRTASWLFPAYLAAITLFVLPLGVAGLLTFTDEAILRDMTVLALPLEAHATGVVLAGMLGGLSAAAAMVIVASVALSIMICNDLVLPLLLTTRGASRGSLAPPILGIRRAAIAALVGLAFVYLAVAGDATLDAIGLLSYAAIAQLAPAFFGGLFWRRANARGAAAGLVAGALVWAWCLLLPSLDPASLPVGGLLDNGPFGLAALRPRDLFGLGLPPFVNGALWSLAANMAAYLLFSLARPLTAIERLQAEVFCGAGRRGENEPSPAWQGAATAADIEALVARYLGSARTRQAFAARGGASATSDAAARVADPRLLHFAEGLLATVIGAASARLVLTLGLQKDSVSPRAARDLLDTAAASIQYNRDLLQHALDHARQGITVTDADLRLLAWNREFRDLFKFPDELLRAGLPLADLLRHNAERSFYGPGDIEELVAARVAALRGAREPMRLRVAPLGMVVEVRSATMPDGGLVTTYSDVTQSVRTEEALEARVRERTVELEQANRLLVDSKTRADSANLSKTRFLAAASHDILQPLNAARLYAAALLERKVAAPEAELVGNLAASLDSVEEIIAALLEISRLDAGAQKPEITDFPASEMFRQLRIEFEPAAKLKGLRLRFLESGAILRSDRRLLRRLMQNLVSNAVKYTQKGGVAVGCRRAGDAWRLDVWDSGLGIAPEQMTRIFDEFRRLDEGARIAPGLGLGLSIVERLRQVLGHRLILRSRPGKGSLFALEVPRGAGATRALAEAGAANVPGTLGGLAVAVIDNEPAILDGMRALFESWGCGVTTAASREAIMAALGEAPDAILADYHLDGDTGLAVIAALRARFGEDIEAVLITADRSAPVRRQAEEAGVHLLNKPLKPAALRALLQRARTRQAAA